MGKPEEMEEYLVDTNILLRYLLRDIEDQFEFAKKQMVLAQERKIVIFIPLLVFVEINFILRGLYQQPKEKVIGAIRSIAEQSFLDIENREIILASLRVYERSVISLVDAVFVAQAKNRGLKLLTFDKKLAGLMKI